MPPKSSASAHNMMTTAPSNSNVTTGTSDNEDRLEARPTQRMGKNTTIQADGDTWQETLAVCEAPPAAKNAGDLLIRSYFQNARSGKRVWDEPPSGATTILPASEEMRRMANVQLDELHVVDKRTSSNGTSSSSNPAAKPKPKRRGLFGFGRHKKDKAKSAEKSQNSRKIQYKPGSNVLAGKNLRASRGGTNGGGGDSDNAQLQEAIARSLAESQGIPYEAIRSGGGDASRPSSVAAANPNNTNGIAHTSIHDFAALTGEDDELDMAKALSLSSAQEQGETEDQLLARILEESRFEEAMNRGSAAAASSYPDEEDDLLGLYSDAGVVPASLDDRKPSALPSSSPSPSPSLPSAAPHPPPSPTLAYPSAMVNSSFAASATATAAAFTLKSPPKSPVARFDPYDKNAPPIIRKSPPPASAAAAAAALQESSSLQKMDTNASKKANAAGRLHFGKRSSTRKMQDKAGLV